MVVEFIGYFRMKAGCEYIEIDLPGSSALKELIASVEDQLKERAFEVLEGDRLKEGVLLFRRNEGGGLERCDLAEPLSGSGGRIIMANLMGGG